MHGSSYLEMYKFIETLPKTRLTIADVGSYDINGTYKPLCLHEGWTYTGLDQSEGPNVDVVLASEYDWSNVPTNSFDVVISGQTLEHTRNPFRLVKEMVRIAKPGAWLCIIAPYQWQYHPFPIDCWRVFPDGMKAVLEENGLVVKKVYMTENEDPKRKGDTIGIGRKPDAIGGPQL